MARREVTVRLEEKYFFEFEDRCHQLRVKKQHAVEEALAAWMTQKQPGLQLVAASPAPAGATKEEQAQVARFLDFLRTGDPGQVELVTHALDLHQKKQRRLRKPG